MCSVDCCLGAGWPKYGKKSASVPSGPSTDAEETFLPTANDDWKKIAEHLDAVEQQADAI